MYRARLDHQSRFVFCRKHVENNKRTTCLHESTQPPVAVIARTANHWQGIMTFSLSLFGARERCKLAYLSPAFARRRLLRMLIQQFKIT